MKVSPLVAGIPGYGENNNQLVLSTKNEILTDEFG